MTITTAARRLMGTDARVIVCGGEVDALTLFDQLDALEASWSRFLPGNELSRLHASAGSVTVVSPPMFCLVEHLVAAHRLTGGRFDPTLADQLVALGYDRTYRSLADGSEPIADPSPAPPMMAVADRIELFRRASAVLLAPSTRLDPGGLGKGLAADIVARSAVEAGARGVLVDLGGDIVTRGVSPDGGPWRIDIPETSQHPQRVVELSDGAVATSDSRARTWLRGGEEIGHILDPGTGRSVSGALSATVIAGSGWWAEAAATAAIISQSRRDGWLDVDRCDELGLVAFVTERTAVDA